ATSSFSSLNMPSTPVIYTLSLHDALPIYRSDQAAEGERRLLQAKGSSPKRFVHLFRNDGRSDGSERGQEDPLREEEERKPVDGVDRKSTRLNSSHVKISYAVFCLKEKRHN